LPQKKQGETAIVTERLLLRLRPIGQLIPAIVLVAYPAGCENSLPTVSLR